MQAPSLTLSPPICGECRSRYPTVQPILAPLDIYMCARCTQDEAQVILDGESVCVACFLAARNSVSNTKLNSGQKGSQNIIGSSKGNAHLNQHIGSTNSGSDKASIVTSFRDSMTPIERPEVSSTKSIISIFGGNKEQSLLEKIEALLLSCSKEKSFQVALEKKSKIVSTGPNGNQMGWEYFWKVSRKEPNILVISMTKMRVLGGFFAEPVRNDKTCTFKDVSCGVFDADLVTLIHHNSANAQNLIRFYHCQKDSFSFNHEQQICKFGDPSLLEFEFTGSVVKLKGKMANNEQPIFICVIKL